MVKFRLYDVVSGQEMGDGLQFAGTTDAWRRVAHKVADQVYSQDHGRGRVFRQPGRLCLGKRPKNDRKKRLAIMDYDGANAAYLTDSANIVLAPRFRPMAAASCSPPSPGAFRASM